LPITVWSTSRTCTAMVPSAPATGPMLPAWQSPQIHTAGPSGKATRCESSSHS
jgi:hypothetical protein